MKYALCNEMFESTPFDQMCATVAELGYEALEISPFTLGPHVTQISQEQRKSVRQTADQHGLKILGIHWLLANVVSPVPLYVTHPEKSVRKDTADYFIGLTQLCADLGGHIMVIGSPKNRSLMPGVTCEQAMTYAAEVFTPCLDLAARHNIKLAIEPLTPKETDFLNTAQDGIELIQRINHPNFQLHLDVKAMSSESKPIPQIIKDSAKHMVHFHVNDPNLLGPGMGDVKYEPIIQALREVNYNGYLSVEVFDFKPGARHIAQQSINYLKEVISRV